MALFKIFTQSQLDLTPLIVTARRGLRRDVQRLCDALPNGQLLIPLASSVKGTAGAQNVILRKGTEILSHLLPHPDDPAKQSSVLFTTQKLLASIQETTGWTTDGGPLQSCSVAAKDAIEFAAQAIDRGQAFGLVINPYHESELELAPDEVRSLANGKPIPLIHYVRNVPVQEGETFLVGEPAVPPPAELVETVNKYTASHPEITGYQLVQIFNAERDIEAHMVLNIFTTAAEVDQREISREVQLIIAQRTVPPPGYIDVMFNAKL